MEEQRIFSSAGKINVTWKNSIYFHLSGDINAVWKSSVYCHLAGNTNAAWKSKVYSHLSMEIPMLHGRAAYIQYSCYVFFSAVLG